VSGAGRIVILGCAGTGKTRLARRLGERLAAPVIDLDEVWASPAVGGDLAAFRVAIAKAHAGPAWISDGNFSLASFDLRLPRAELIVWLERPRWLCLWRAAARVLGPGEFHRPGDLRKVAAFIWSFDRVNRPRIEAERLRHGREVPVRRLATDREVATFLEGLGGGGTTQPPLTPAKEGVAPHGAG
jgi:adenylate kinase family enzyme